MSDEITFGSLIECPWCGWTFNDSCDYETGDYECEACNKPIRVEVEMSVTYTTTKREDG